MGSYYLVMCHAFTNNDVRLCYVAFLTMTSRAEVEMLLHTEYRAVILDVLLLIRNRNYDQMMFFDISEEIKDEIATKLQEFNFVQIFN